MSQMKNVPTFHFNLKEFKLSPLSIAYLGKVSRYMYASIPITRDKLIFPSVELQDCCSKLYLFVVYY